MLWCGWPFLARGAKSFLTGHLNMFSLIGMGVVAAYAFSVVALLAPGLFPEGFRDAGGVIGELNRQGRQLWHPSSSQCLVDRGQLSPENSQRPCIEDHGVA